MTMIRAKWDSDEHKWNRHFLSRKAVTDKPPTIYTLTPGSTHSASTLDLRLSCHEQFVIDVRCNWSFNRWKVYHEISDGLAKMIMDHERLRANFIGMLPEYAPDGTMIYRLFEKWPYRGYGLPQPPESGLYAFAGNHGNNSGDFRTDAITDESVRAILSQVRNRPAHQGHTYSPSAISLLMPVMPRYNPREAFALEDSKYDLMYKLFTKEVFALQRTNHPLIKVTTS